MNDLLDLAGFLAPLRGAPRALRRATSGEARDTPRPGEAIVRDAFLRPEHAGSRALRFLAFPGTGGGFVLLNADSSAAFRAGAQLLPRGRWVTRCMSNVLRAISHVGLESRVAPRRIEIVEAADRTERPLHERFSGLPRELLFNVASGVPDRDQKTVVQLVTADGAIAGYAKIGRSETARALVRHEADTLRRVAGLGVEAPRSLGIESAHAHDMLVQSAIPGRRSPGRLDARHARYLERIESATARQLPLAAVESHGRALARFAAVAARADAEWRELFGALARSLATRRVRCALAHGDFTPWNVIVAGDRAIAFDWEHARACAPRGFDAIHFALQQAVLVEHVPPPRVYARVLAHSRGACPPSSAAARDVELAAYVFDVAVSDEARELERRSPFVQTSWLRASRLELARVVLERIGAEEARAA